MERGRETKKLLWEGSKSHLSRLFTATFTPILQKDFSVCITNFSLYQHLSYGFQRHPLQHVILNASVAPTSPRYKGVCLFVCFKEKECPNTCCLGKCYQLLFTYGARVLRSLIEPRAATGLKRSSVSKQVLEPERRLQGALLFCFYSSRLTPG